MIDLTNQRFGRLVALEPTEKRERNLVVWRCQCDCGNVCEVPSAALRSGNTRSCGCLKGGPDETSVSRDLSGQRFGKLVAVEPVGRKNGYVVWRCQCDCGNEKDVTSFQLTSGKTRSCGCLRRGRRAGGQATGDGAARDLSGQRFGRLIAERQIGTRGGYALWQCRCDCGAVMEATSSALRTGNTRSCGCLRAGGISALAGQRFGTLYAVNNTGVGRGAHAEWRCLCDCGTVIRVEACSLTDGTTTSCGHCS